MSCIVSVRVPTCRCLFYDLNFLCSPWAPRCQCSNHIYWLKIQPYFLGPCPCLAQAGAPSCWRWSWYCWVIEMFVIFSEPLYTLLLGRIRLWKWKSSPIEFGMSAFDPGGPVSRGWSVRIFCIQQPLGYLK